MAENTSTSFNAQAKPTLGRESAQATPAPEIDPAPYLAELEACGLSSDQASEFLETLVPLIWHFVDLGFRGDISELFVSGEESGTVNWSHPPSQETQTDAQGKEASP